MQFYIYFSGSPKIVCVFLGFAYNPHYTGWVLTPIFILRSVQLEVTNFLAFFSEKTNIKQILHFNFRSCNYRRCHTFTFAYLNK